MVWGRNPASLSVCLSVGNIQFNSDEVQVGNAECTLYRYSGIVTKDDSGSGGNQIVYYLHLQVPLIYFRYQYFPVSFLVSIEFEFDRGISSILFIHPTPEGIQTHPSAVQQSRTLAAQQ